jgi:ornithine cyclodeaminase
MESKGFVVRIVPTPGIVAAEARLIVTATASATPLLKWSDIQPGTHITAVGADSATKHEIEETIIETADIVVTDSRAQAVSRGELLHASMKNPSVMSRVTEIGELVSHIARGRNGATQITVATLSGLAVQDVAIASAVMSPPAML